MESWNHSLLSRMERIHSLFGIFDVARIHMAKLVLSVTSGLVIKGRQR